jgi:hypothetical protein
VQFETDEDGRLDKLFYEMPGSKKKFERGAFSQPRAQLLLYDTTVGNPLYHPLVVLCTFK